MTMDLPNLLDKSVRDIRSFNILRQEESDDELEDSPKATSRATSGTTRRVLKKPLDELPLNITDETFPKTTSNATDDAIVKETTKEIKKVNYKLTSSWIVWLHENDSSSWADSSYMKLYEIHSITTFWNFMFNLRQLDMTKYQLYIMRNTSGPTWEHETNKHGGITSIRVNKDKLFEVIEQLLFLIVNESLVARYNEINGISFGIKGQWSIIKVWNMDRNYDTSNFIPSYIRKEYNTQPRYKETQAEY